MRAPTWVGTLMQALLRSVLSVSMKARPLRVVDLELEVRHGALAHGPLELGRVHVGVRVPELVRVHAAAAEDCVLGELHHLLGDHAPRLELPPLAVLELHEARHEGAAGEAVGPVQPPGPGARPAGS